MNISLQRRQALMIEDGAFSGTSAVEGVQSMGLPCLVYFTDQVHLRLSTNRFQGWVLLRGGANRRLFGDGGYPILYNVEVLNFVACIHK